MSTKDPNYVKQAMRNMAQKGGTSFKHFALTVLGLIGVLLSLAIVFH